MKNIFDGLTSGLDTESVNMKINQQKLPELKCKGDREENEKYNNI